MIASDKWIRRMALEHGMIDPFCERLVTQGKVSYGLSSYGYDVRVGKNFKIFHNLNSTLIDPKNFDAKSFVDHEGDCIIPPNSFVLAETMEHFRIPRNVLCVCLGKCVTGDTRVVDADTGEYLPIREFGSRGRTIGMKGWKLDEVPVSAFVPQGPRPVYELRTRLGLRLRATANHPFRTFGGWVPLEDLRAGDRIASARYVPVFGSTPLPQWEAALLGFMISEGQCDTPGHSPVFTNADPVLVRAFSECVRTGLGMEVTFNGHMGYRMVNHVGRGGVPLKNAATRWLASHGQCVKSRDKFVPQAVFRAPIDAVRTFLSALFSGDGGLNGSGEDFVLEYHSMSRRLVEDVRHLLLRFGIVTSLFEKATQVGTTCHGLRTTDRGMIRRFDQEIGFWPGSEKQARMNADVAPVLETTPPKRSNVDTLPSEAWELMRRADAHADGGLRRRGWRFDSRQSVPMGVALDAALVTEDPALADLALAGPVWDRVESIEPAGVEEVYDLTVPGAESFLANDLIVHNSTYARCGIIVNVTPLEPEWQGVVTIEISNTTPLPAKIYAGEGIAQILFFLGNEVCETSYADRKGKYQDQAGLTLPKVT